MRRRPHVSTFAAMVFPHAVMIAACLLFDYCVGSFSPWLPSFFATNAIICLLLVLRTKNDRPSFLLGHDGGPSDHGIDSVPRCLLRFRHNRIRILNQSEDVHIGSTPDVDGHVLRRDFLDPITVRLGYKPKNCLTNYYPDGDASMGYHFDAAEAGIGIAIVSLGAERSISFRSQRDKTLIEVYKLKNGSLLFMSQEMQAERKHAILPSAVINGGRISLTFRRMKTG